MSTTQIAAFTVTQIKNLTSEQIAAMSPRQLGAMTTTQLAVLSRTTVDGLTAPQIAALTVTPDPKPEQCRGQRTERTTVCGAQRYTRWPA